MPPEQTTSSTKAQQTSPDYAGLVQMLIEPLLESPDSLKVDCEHSNQNQRVWIRVAFEGDDKGRVFGRGGRNIQAIRTVLASAAKMAGQSIYLDIYGTHNSSSNPEDSSAAKQGGKKRQHRRSSRPKPSVKSRSQE